MRDITPARFYPELESLRGIAALSVVGLHASLLTGGLCAIGNVRQCAVMMLTPGNASVVLFFVLSGFVLSLGIWEPSFSFTRYVVRRVFRLMPPAWVAISIAILVSFMLGEAIDWGDALHATYFAGSFAINPPLWTLQQEFYLSILFLPVAAAAAARLGGIGNALLLAATYFYFYADLNLFTAYMMYLGCLVPAFGTWIVGRLQKSPLASALVVIVAAASFVATIPVFDLSGDLPLALSLAALPSFLAVAYFVAGDEGPLFGLMRTGLARFLGRISYSVYILHWTVLKVVLHMTTGRASVTILTVLGTIALAVPCYYLVERPSIRLGAALVGTRISLRSSGLHLLRLLGDRRE